MDYRNTLLQKIWQLNFANFRLRLVFLLCTNLQFVTGTHLIQNYGIQTAMFVLFWFLKFSGKSQDVTLKTYIKLKLYNKTIDFNFKKILIKKFYVEK